MIRVHTSAILLWLALATQAAAMVPLPPAVFSQLEQITTSSRYTNSGEGLIVSAQNELATAQQALADAKIATTLRDKKRYIEHLAHAIDPAFTGGRGPGNGDGLANLMPALVTRLTYVSQQPNVSLAMSNASSLAVETARGIQRQTAKVLPIVSDVRTTNDPFAVDLYLRELDDIVSALAAGQEGQPGVELLVVQVRQLQDAAQAMPVAP